MGAGAGGSEAGAVLAGVAEEPGADTAEAEGVGEGPGVDEAVGGAVVGLAAVPESCSSVSVASVS